MLSVSLPLPSPAQSHPDPSPSHPNILFVLTDDLGFGDLGVYFQKARRDQGLPAFHTPHLDQLAAEGVRMDRHYSSSPVCAPARASLLTGMHQGHANVRDNEFDKTLENNHTLATILKEAGYATAMVGKWGLGGNENQNFPGHPLNRGFDFYFGVMHHTDAHYHYPKEFNQRMYENFDLVTADLDKAYSTDLFTARAKKWISDHHQSAPNQPFFLYLAYTAPHARLEVPTQAYPPDGGTTGGVQWTGTPGAMINTASGTIDSWIHPDYADQGWPDHAQRHATMVRRLDDAIGDLLQHLADLDLDDNTLIVFTSDNGPHHEAGHGGTIAQDPRFFRTYGPLDGVKRDLWEGGIRVPTLVRWPNGLPAGRVSTHPSQFHDWLPTFAELAGLAPPFRSDGVSLLNDLTGDAPPLTGTVYFEYTTKWHWNTPDYSDFHSSRRGQTRGNMQALYLDGVKGVRYNVQSATDPFLVHEPLGDPQEITNLAGNPGIPSQNAFEDAVLRLRRPHPHDPNWSPARAYDTAAVPAYDLPSSESGVKITIFEADLPHVTHFAGLSPVVETTTQGFDLSDRPRDHDIGFRFTGWLHVPATGNYTFFLNTDTGAVMRLHDILLLDADFNYPGNTEINSGVIRLEAGYHPYQIHSRHAGPGTPYLTLAWSGSGISKTPIPTTNLVQAGPPPPLAAPDVNGTTEGGIPVDLPRPQSLPSGAVITSVGPTQSGSAELNDSFVRFTPTEGFFGSITFPYTIEFEGETDEGLITVNVIFVDPEMIWLPFEKGFGNLIFESGGREIGYLAGFEDPDTAWVSGYSGNALAFNGQDQALVLDHSYLPPSESQSRTVSAWIQTDSPGMIVAWGLKEPTRKWHFRLDSETEGYGLLRIEVEGGFRRGSTNLLDGEWHHVAVVLPDGANNVDQARLFVNGVEDLPYTTLSQTIATTSTPVHIGTNQHDSPKYFDGRIDEVRIRNFALSSAEIEAEAALEDQQASLWHRRNYGPAEIDWLAVDNEDGLARLQLFAFGGNPHQRGQTNLMPRLVKTDEKNSLRLGYHRPINEIPGLNFQWERSTDLQQWNPFEPVEVQTIPLDSSENHQKVIIEPDISPLPTKQFWRLRVCLNGPEKN